MRLKRYSQPLLALVVAKPFACLDWSEHVGSALVVGLALNSFGIHDMEPIFDLFNLLTQ